MRKNESKLFENGKIYEVDLKKIDEYWSKFDDMGKAYDMRSWTMKLAYYKFAYKGKPNVDVFIPKRGSKGVKFYIDRSWCREVK